MHLHPWVPPLTLLCCCPECKKGRLSQNQVIAMWKNKCKNKRNEWDRRSTALPTDFIKQFSGYVSSICHMESNQSSKNGISLLFHERDSMLAQFVPTSDMKILALMILHSSMPLLCSRNLVCSNRLCLQVLQWNAKWLSLPFCTLLYLFLLFSCFFLCCNCLISWILTNWLNQPFLFALAPVLHRTGFLDYKMLAITCSFLCP